jgi:hypothetical protein
MCNGFRLLAASTGKLRHALELEHRQEPSAVAIRPCWRGRSPTPIRSAHAHRQRSAQERAHRHFTTDLADVDARNIAPGRAARWGTTTRSPLRGGHQGIPAGEQPNSRLITTKELDFTSRGVSVQSPSLPDGHH